jgi:hypothetical protein
MLFIHDIHAVIGEHEFDFEDAVRGEYAPAVAEDGARLLWYLHATHGAGEAYSMVTLTAVRDGAAWERLVQRLRYGDLATWREKVDAMRYASTSTLLVQVPWSPLGEVDLDSVPAAEGPERDVVVLREDTLHGPGIATTVEPAAPTAEAVLTCAAAFTPALGDGSTLQVLHRVAPRSRWTPAFGLDTGWDDWPGSLTTGLPDGTRRSTRMLRTTPWSPLP